MILEDGIYLNLEEQEYFSQRRMGSSALRKLAADGSGFWWSSRLNPFYVPKDTKAQNEGRAAHCILLEGVKAYESRFIVMPEKEDYKGLLTTIDSMKEALDAAGIEYKKSGSSSEFKALCRTHLPDQEIWEDVLKAFDDARGKRQPITKEQDFSLRCIYDAAMSDKELCDVLGHGSEYPILSEVSFLWTDEMGLRRCARFDKLLPNATIDVKSVANWQKKDLVFNTGLHIIKEGMAIQLADQHDARSRMFKLIRDTSDMHIHGGTEDQRIWLEAMAIRNVPWKWVWLFAQKPDRNVGLAPILFPVEDEWGGPFHRQGVRECARAKAVYHEYVAKFGLKNPWFDIKPVHSTNPTSERAIMLPDDKHFNLIPVENEQEAFER